MGRVQALGARPDQAGRLGDGALTVLDSSNGRKLAKKGAKACPPAAAARAGMASPACSSNMASYSACGARGGAGAPGPSSRTGHLLTPQSATGCWGWFSGRPCFTDSPVCRLAF